MCNWVFFCFVLSFTCRWSSSWAILLIPAKTRGLNSSLSSNASHLKRRERLTRVLQGQYHVAGIGARSSERILNVIITGANRGLGFAIAQLMVSFGHRVVLACRNHDEGIAALDRLRSQERGAEVLASVHPLDVTNPQSVDRFQRSCVRDYLGGKVDILFNNAGVCLQGQGHAVLESTLGVNFFGALRVIEACLPALKGMNPSVLACDVPVRQDLGSATVVWITSGDGELCFLGSKWQAILEQASCVEEIECHLRRLLLATSRIDTERSRRSNGTSSEDISIESADGRWNPDEEIAFGPTPAYSLSKAAANTAVRVLAPAMAKSHGVRLVAVCPGDVISRMSSQDEISRGDAVSPEEAACAVVDVALRPRDFQPGAFYRSGQLIPW